VPKVILEALDVCGCTTANIRLLSLVMKAFRGRRSYPPWTGGEPYSPNDVEDKFSEVRSRNLTWIGPEGREGFA
jgi:hypothetical protein